MKSKDLIKSSINIAFAGVAMKSIDNANLPNNLGSLAKLTVATATIKDTGKKLKVL